MARKRRYLGRPADHLQLAAQAHARIAVGPEPATGDDAEAATEPDNPTQSRRAKAQRRNAGGRFA